MKLNKNDNGREIRDDEIRILGAGRSSEGKDTPKRRIALAALAAAVLLVVALVLIHVSGRGSEVPSEEPVQGLYEEQDIAETAAEDKSYMEIKEITLAGVPMRILIPVNASPRLLLGPQDLSGQDFVFIAQAADVRADNKEILGEFVLDGVKMARGRSKLGWCSIIGGEIRLGCSAEPQEMADAQELGGSFFRQYGLVAGGEYVKDSNSKKYESVRRAVCNTGDEVFVIETLEPMSLLLFAHALEEFGVDNAVALVGGPSYGYAVDGEGRKVEFGDVERNLIFESTSYLVWE